MIDVLLVGLLSAAVFFLFIYVYVRENSINKRLKRYDRTFELINQNIHKLEKELHITPNQPHTDTHHAELEEFSEVSRVIIEKFQELQKDNLEFKEGIVERYMELEGKVKPFVSVGTQMVGSNDESKIASLFSSGHSIEEIAKMLRIGTGEVEFVLKLHDIK